MEIGDRVKWQIHGKFREGILRQDLGDKAEVICIKFQDVSMAIKTIVDKNILTLI